MAKASRAKVKMLQGQAKRDAALRKAVKKVESDIPDTRAEVDPGTYQSVDGAWRAIGLDAQARRGLIDEGLFEISDLRKLQLDAVKQIHGVGPNAIRVLIAEMKKKDIKFR